MTLALILSIGEDAALLESRSAVLRSAGYAVEIELSVTRARERFVDGDFDLVLLCHSISPEDRGRLVSSIRATGSRTPIVFIATLESQVPDALADASVGNVPTELLRGIEEILLTVDRRSVRREARFPFLIRSGMLVDAATGSAGDPSIKMPPSPATADALNLMQVRDQGARERAHGK